MTADKDTCDATLCDVSDSHDHVMLKSWSKDRHPVDWTKCCCPQVKYGKSLIGGASHPATFVRVYDICGPTYPGEFEAKARTYTLHYPGLAFLFPIPPQHAEAVSENHIGMPLEFPDGSTPLAARICIYTASEGDYTTRFIQMHIAATLYRTQL